jgi:hypothetical protein
MGIVQMTVKCKPKDLCKFSVTFWVDNKNRGPRLVVRIVKIAREVIFPLKTMVWSARGYCTNIFLTGKFPGRAEFP